MTQEDQPEVSVHAYDPYSGEYFVQGLDHSQPNAITWVAARWLVPHFQAVLQFHSQVIDLVDQQLIDATGSAKHDEDDEDVAICDDANSAELLQRYADEADQIRSGKLICTPVPTLE